MNFWRIVFTRVGNLSQYNDDSQKWHQHLLRCQSVKFYAKQRKTVIRTCDLIYWKFKILQFQNSLLIMTALFALWHCLHNGFRIRGAEKRFLCYIRATSNKPPPPPPRNSMKVEMFTIIQHGQKSSLLHPNWRMKCRHKQAGTGPNRRHI